MAETVSPRSALTSASAETEGARLWRALREAGVRAVYGDADRGLPVTARVPARLAPTLVAAHERVHRERAASWVDGVLTIGRAAAASGASGPSDAAGPVLGGAPDGWQVLLDEPDRVPDLVAMAVHAAATGRGVALRVDLDLDRPAPDRRAATPGAATLGAPASAGPMPAGAASGGPDPAGETEAVLALVTAAERPVVLVGPGVIAAGAVPGLHAFATAGQVGVLNTWGAKGVFPWQSPHHWATIGLQRDDFRLAGLADADLIVAVGLDPHESPAACWQLAPQVTIDPASLGTLALAWRRPPGLPEMPPLRHRLAEATQRGWTVEAGPLPPSRVTRTYGEIAAHGGLIAADPGVAGYWVARTVGTTVLDSVIVPGARVPAGFAIAAALVARIASPARPVLAVLDDPASAAGSAGSASAAGAAERIGELVELAASLGLPVPVEAWSDDGPAPDAGAHAARLRDAVHGESPVVARLRTDPHWLARMTDVAGPVVAWSQILPANEGSTHS